MSLLPAYFAGAPAAAAGAPAAAAGASPEASSAREDSLKLLHDMGREYRRAGASLLLRIDHRRRSSGCQGDWCRVVWLEHALNATFRTLDRHALHLADVGTWLGNSSGVPTAVAALLYFLQGAAPVNEDLSTCDQLRETVSDLRSRGKRTDRLLEWARMCGSALMEGGSVFHDFVQSNPWFLTLLFGKGRVLLADAPPTVGGAAVAPAGFAFRPGPVVARVIADTVCRHGLCEATRGAYVHMAEIGVREAETSTYLLQAFPNLRLLLVDPYFVNDYQVTPTFRGADRVRGRATMAMKDYRERSVQLFTTGRNAASDLAPRSLDVVFVDGDHSYEGCDGDIRTWWPLIRPGGLLIGHDYHLAWPGVVRAVHEFAQSSGLPLHLQAGVWWFEKPPPVPLALPAVPEDRRRWRELLALRPFAGLPPPSARRLGAPEGWRPVPCAPTVQPGPPEADPECWAGRAPSLQGACCAYLAGLGTALPADCPELVRCCRPAYVDIRPGELPARRPQEPPPPPAPLPASPAPARTKLAAVLVTGQARSLASPLPSGELVAENIRRHLFRGLLGEALAPGGQGFDVFWLLDTRSSRFEPQTSDPTACEALRPEGCDACELVCAVVPERDLDLSWIPERVLRGTWANRLQSIMYTVFAFRRVHRLMEAHARERGLSYQWIIRMRPDAFFTSPLPAIRSFPAHDRVVFIGKQWPTDYFALGRPSAMRVYFTTVSGFNDTAYQYRLLNTWQTVDGWAGLDNIWGTEEIIFHWLDMHGVLPLIHASVELEVLRPPRRAGEEAHYSHP